MNSKSRCPQNILSCIAFLLLVLYNSTPAKSQTEDHSAKKNINLMIVHSFEKNLADYPDFNKRVVEKLKDANLSVRTNIFYLDCDAYDRYQELDRINHYLDTVSFKPDVILVTDDQAHYSLLYSKHPLLKTIPIVFTGVNFPNRELLKQYPNVTGIWDYPDYEKNIEMIEKLVGIKLVHFFYDWTYNGKKVISRLAEQYKDRDTNVYKALIDVQKIENGLYETKPVSNSHNDSTSRRNDYDERPMQTSLRLVNMWEESGHDLLWNITGSFQYSIFLLGKYDYSIANIGRLATVPTFSAVSKGFTYKQDILGGYFSTMEDLADEACNYIYRLHQGENITNLPIKQAPKKYMLDWEVMTRWNMDLKQVPAEFIVINVPLYIKYGTEAIILSVLLVLATTLLITYLLFLYLREAKRKRKAQMDLQEEKEFLSLAMEGSSIFAWRYSSTNNEFIFDKEFTDSIGFGSTVIQLDDLTQKTHPDDVKLAVSTFISIVKGIESRGIMRVRINFNGRGYVWYEFRILNISGVFGDHSSVIGLVMNIQDYKNKEQELTTARDMALKAELKESFLANMSHEIRTPLNAIVGFSNILVNDPELPNEEKLDYIRIINQNCELMLKLINDILEISRIESGNISISLEPCNVNDLVNDAYEMCALQSPSNVEFFKSTLPHPLYIDTDIIRLKQVLVNFIGNAFKFTRSGYVKMGIELDELTKEVIIYVEDTGRGISEEHQRMIFERFYKVDEFVQGTGLGLPICQVIANKLRGRITLASEQNKGSRFSLILPYADKSASPQSEQEQQNDSPQKDKVISGKQDHRPVILIAEDSVSNYMVLNNILKKYCQILWVINGKDALELLKKRNVDLVFMDIKMSEMDGITALTKLRKTHKKLPVIIQTAYTDDENRKLAYQAGASGFITKPISPNMLMEIIRKYLDKIESVDF